MHPAKVKRDRLDSLTDLPNIGPSLAADLESLGYETPEDLRGKSGFDLYRELCDRTGQRQDPCVLDTFISVARFLAGERPKTWWSFTAERKRTYPDL